MFLDSRWEAFWERRGKDFIKRNPSKIIRLSRCFLVMTAEEVLFLTCHWKLCLSFQWLLKRILTTLVELVYKEPCWVSSGDSLTVASLSCSVPASLLSPLFSQHSSTSAAGCCYFKFCFSLIITFDNFLLRSYQL